MATCGIVIKGKVVRDEDIVVVEVTDFVFNGTSYEEIHIPLNHINYDKSNNKRSDWTTEEVVEIVIEMLHSRFLELDGENNGVLYFSFIGFYNKRSYKLVFSIRGNELIIRVLTMFRVSKK